MKLLLENWRKYLSEDDSEVSPDLTKIAFNSMLAMAVFKDDGNINEDVQEYDYVISKASEPNLQLVEEFYDSLHGGKRAGFLSPYSLKELSEMDLYKLKDHNAGFAIKDGDDIVNVHNNSDLSRLGSEFMKKAKEVGGQRLDHFDGFLSGLYRKYGFIDVYGVYQWEEQYKPKEWTYDSINIFNPKTSIYAETMEDKENISKDIKVVAEDGYEIVINPADKVGQYRHGMPDVVFRRLN